LAARVRRSRRAGAPRVEHDLLGRGGGAEREGGSARSPPQRGCPAAAAVCFGGEGGDARAPSAASRRLLSSARLLNPPPSRPASPLPLSLQTLSSQAVLDPSTPLTHQPSQTGTHAVRPLLETTPPEKRAKKRAREKKMAPPTLPITVGFPRIGPKRELKMALERRGSGRGRAPKPPRPPRSSGTPTHRPIPPPRAEQALPALDPPVPTLARARVRPGPARFDRRRS